MASPLPTNEHQTVLNATGMASRPGWVYKGKIRHRRYSPLGHEFAYRLFQPCLDLEQLPKLARRTFGLSVERFNLSSYRRRDHMGDVSEPLAETIRNRVADEAGVRPEGPVMMLAHLAYLGYALNPICLFFCHNKNQQLTHIVAEVHNTPWGEHCSYLLPISGEPDSPQEFSTKKAMHVSPFMPMDMEYRWKIRVRDEQLVVHIENWREEKRVFDATLTLTPKPLTSFTLTTRLALMPLMTVQVAVGIYWQAFRLWLKKTPYIPHPKHLPENVAAASPSAANTAISAKKIEK